MASVDLNHFKIINNLIDRDSKDATYKYALIRGSIEVFQNYDHYREESGNEMIFPMGLLIERWLLYYYPIFESDFFIPQMGADTQFIKGTRDKPKFRAAFDPVITYYHEKGNGFSQMYSDYHNGSIPPEILESFLALLIQIRNTIVDMPMVHLGYSISNKENEIFRAKKVKPSREITSPVDPMFLLKYFGKFFIKREYYEAFKNAGPFLIGDNSILFRWAQFSERRVEDDRIGFGEILRTLAESPVEEREIEESKRFYRYLMGKHIPLRSVWSGTPFRSPDDLNYDHMIPFSVWKNNDLWNILPSKKSENADKSDKIPDPALLRSQKEHILRYWSAMMEFNPGKFSRQIRYSLIGENFDPALWQDQAFSNLEIKCRHLIEDLGYPSWNNK